MAKNDWYRTVWGELATLEYGKALRGYQDATGRYRVFGTNGPIGWSDQSLYQLSSIIVGRKGAYRGIHYTAEPFFVIDTAFYLKPIVKFDMKWAYYELLTHDINGMDSGSAIPSTSREAFYRLPVRVPPLDEQRAIADILGSLDEKFELNRRMNQTLEAMARAIFKSWFIDFDPVRAKVDGNPPPGLDPATAALFPDTFHDSPLGPIPQGWEVKPLPEVIDVNPRRTLKKGSVAPYLDMGNMPTASARAIEWYDREFKSGTKFINGDVLVARITPCLENGKTAFVDFLEDDQTGWGSTEYIILRSRPPLPVEYAYFLARSEPFRTHAIVNMTGSSGRQRVPASCLDNLNVVVPPPALAERFGEFAFDVLRSMKQRDGESHILSRLRDTLLPKLLSGRLRIDKANHIPEEVA